MNPLVSEAPERFLQAFNGLAATKSGMSDDVKQEVYWETLSDLPIQSVEEAARQLRRDPGAFLPDAGRWYRLADEIAVHALTADTDTVVKEITDGRETSQGEEQRIWAARRLFIVALEALTEKTVAADSPFRTEAPKIPVYACLTCHDVGWVDDGTGANRWERCLCSATNPVLEQHRAHGRLRQARKRGA